MAGTEQEFLLAGLGKVCLSELFKLVHQQLVCPADVALSLIISQIMSYVLVLASRIKRQLHDEAR